MFVRCTKYSPVINLIYSGQELLSYITKGLYLKNFTAAINAIILITAVNIL
jgi:hypothetical protein